MVSKREFKDEDFSDDIYLNTDSKPVKRLSGGKAKRSDYDKEVRGMVKKIVSFFGSSPVSSSSPKVYYPAFVDSLLDEYEGSSKLEKLIHLILDRSLESLYQESFDSVLGAVRLAYLGKYVPPSLDGLFGNDGSRAVYLHTAVSDLFEFLNVATGNFEFPFPFSSKYKVKEFEFFRDFSSFGDDTIDDFHLFFPPYTKLVEAYLGLNEKNKVLTEKLDTLEASVSDSSLGALRDRISSLEAELSRKNEELKGVNARFSELSEDVSYLLKTKRLDYRFSGLCSYGNSNDFLRAFSNVMAKFDALKDENMYLRNEIKRLSKRHFWSRVDYEYSVLK